MTNPLSDDLDDILARTRVMWDELRGQRLFVTGGTGFFGCWLLESFVRANDALGLGAEVTVLTRRPGDFAGKAPHLACHPSVKLHAGDVRTFTFPEGRFSHVIHAATEASAVLNEEHPLLMFDTIVEGTRRVLDFSVQAGVAKVLLTSSGAVYGRQPSEMTHITEEYSGGPDCQDSRSAYGEGKRAAEMLCSLYSRQYGLQAKIARCFAFVGPQLPLDAHFAVGNFIRDALRGGPIVVQGDGTPYRSYLYAADLAVWLWTLLFRAPSGRPYNVGSGDGRTIAGIARAVAELAGGVPLQILGTPKAGQSPSRYVPDVTRAERELGLRVGIGLNESIRRTLAYYRGRPS